MADYGAAEQTINGFPANLRVAMKDLVRPLFKDLRFGHPSGEDVDPAVNFGAAFFTGTTPSTPGEEFSIPHGFGRAPYLLLPVLPLDVVGAQLVPLSVTRVADAKRVYLSSSEADAVFYVLVEG